MESALECWRKGAWLTLQARLEHGWGVPLVNGELGELHLDVGRREWLHTQCGARSGSGSHSAGVASAAAAAVFAASAVEAAAAELGARGAFLTR